MILPIVEGQGDLEAVPVLLRRLCEEASVWSLQIGRPHRRRRTEFVKKNSLQTAVRRAVLEPACSGVLLLFDADDDCPKELAQELETWAQEAAGDKASAVVIASREYEAWFLASIEALRGIRGVASLAVSHGNPEGPRDAKGEFEQRLEPRAFYAPTADQAALTARLDLKVVYQRSRSFRRLVSAFGKLASAAGHPPATWPPPAWSVGG